MKPEKQLYQWDVNQYLTGINPAAQYVDYTIGNDVIRLETDGTRCRIPDEVMQTYGGKTCYERYPDGTFRAYSFNVLYAPKPPDYVYTPEERTTFEALTARVDAAIDEIKRRADSGEFTPKKGVDYFTEAEKNELMEGVSSGAVGEFRKVVDTATTEYNNNHNSKLAEYNANASEKLTTYDTNAEQRTSDYNRNAAEKLEAYNQNHTEKVAEYNTNAETKTAEFDSNAAALQTEVDRLRGECDNLAAENRKQENRIDALIKLNKGQTYDVLEQESEAYSVDVPSGSKYAGIDKVGGKSVAWNQFLKAMINSQSQRGITFTRNDDGSLNISGTITEAFSYNYVPFTYAGLKFKRDGRKYLLMLNKPIPHAWGVSGYGGNVSANSIGGMWSNNEGTNWVNGLVFRAEVGTTIDIQNLRAMVFDLTQMFGSTIADYIYSLEQATTGAGVAWFKNMFPNDYYPYCEPTIISSQTDRIDIVGKNLFNKASIYSPYSLEQITTSFPVLNSAGSVYDYIDLNEGKLHQRVGVVDLGTLQYSKADYGFYSLGLQGQFKINGTESANCICNKYPTVHSTDVPNGIYLRYDGATIITDTTYTDATAFKAAMSGVMLYYELAEEVITDIDIPTELTEWLPVEAGGTVTFRNADESKQLAVPNAVSWVRKLNEVE